MGLYRNFDTQAEIDAEYNVEAAVPDMSPYVELYVGESAKARESLQCTLDISLRADNRGNARRVSRGTTGRPSPHVCTRRLLADTEQ